jgi:hypothetical protein
MAQSPAYPRPLNNGKQLCMLGLQAAVAGRHQHLLAMACSSVGMGKVLRARVAVGFPRIDI